MRSYHNFARLGQRDGALKMGFGAGFDVLQRDVPCVANLSPAASITSTTTIKLAGVGATMQAIKDHLDLSCRLGMGGTVGEFLEQFRRPVDPAVIHTCEDPLYPDGCYAVLYGNLAPGAVW